MGFLMQKHNDKEYTKFLNILISIKSQCTNSHCNSCTSSEKEMVDNSPTKSSEMTPENRRRSISIITDKNTIKNAGVGQIDLNGQNTSNTENIEHTTSNTVNIG